jgi:molybdopterin molybdotransferase
MRDPTAGLLSVDEALAAVLAAVPAPQRERVELATALGAVLAEEVLADHDHPPFPRSKVDGWALRRADVAGGAASLRVVATVRAGTAPGLRLAPGEAARIFTGAPVPDGADAVAMQERCEADAGASTVRVPPEAASAGHVVPQGVECRAGAVAGRVGDVITPGLVGALASAGAARADVFRAPHVRIVATGDELVPCEEQPGPGRIRNSNAPALVAAAAACGAVVDGARRAADDRFALADAVTWALGADVVLVTGGVSVGDFDLVPEVLASLDVTQVLHGVRLQPGKPFWFGTRGRTLVFGLPGNPVSALVNAALFVRPALARLRGGAREPSSFPAVLGGPVGAGTWRRKYVPATVRRDGAAWTATPVPFQGSGDVFGFARAQALVVVPEECAARAAGDAAECVPLFEPLP